MFELTIEPRFAETDALGHISNTTYPLWFEAARDPIFRIFRPSMEVQNWPLILAKIDIDFVAQTYLDSPVHIETYISRIGTSSFDIAQFARQDNELKARGTAVMVRFDYELQKSQPISDDIRTVLEQHAPPDSCKT